MADKVIQIKIAGLLDVEWGRFLDSWTVEPQADNTTVISSIDVDQSALHGLLTKVRDLNLKLVSIDTIHQHIEHPLNNVPTDPAPNAVKKLPQQDIDIYEILWYIYFIFYFMDG